MQPESCPAPYFKYNPSLRNSESGREVMATKDPDLEESPGLEWEVTSFLVGSNCDVKTESNFLLESLAACKGPETETDLEMYFTINLAFVNYFDDMIEKLGIPVSQNWTTQEQILPLSIEMFEISPNLLNAPKTLQDLAVQY